MAALRSYAEDGLVPFSCPGHKRGQGAAGEPRALPGDEVVVGRDLHKSLLVGLILTGARPVYVVPRAHPELGLGLGAKETSTSSGRGHSPRAGANQPHHQPSQRLAGRARSSTLSPRPGRVMALRSVVATRVAPPTTPGSTCRRRAE